MLVKSQCVYKVVYASNNMWSINELSFDEVNMSIIL
jgi:hypothetical protein